MPKLSFNLAGHGQISLAVENLVIAGWTGRDRAMVEHHIAELEAIGVKRPQTVPCFYRVAASLLTQGETIQIPGTDSSGETEFVLYSSPHGLLVGIGSDHTDRKVESYGVTVSKQMCAKPTGAGLWRFDEAADHWDTLLMRAWRTRGGERVLYQEGPVSRMLEPRDLIARYTGGAPLAAGTAMFCGTQPVLTDIGFGERFDMELIDERLGRSLRHAYSIETLPNEG
jgi:hypothetical protein